MVKDELEVVPVYIPGVGVEFEWPGHESSALQTEFAPSFLVSDAAAS